MIIITGQTATGKTKLALEYAQKYNGELVSCDSRQIYKYLDIITGKDLDKYQLSTTNLSLMTHRGLIKPVSLFNPVKTKIWLYNTLTPDQYFSSFDFAQIAKIVIADIKKRGKTPIIIGGTYLYLHHLLYGFDYHVPPNWNLRKELNRQPKEAIQKKLKQLDPEIEKKMNPSDWQNPHRLIRRLEIYLSPNKSYQSYKDHQFYHISDFLGLYFSSKEKLKQAIEKRVEERIKKGAIDEVKKILQMGYQPTDPGLKTIGYQQIIKYLQGQISKDEAINQWIKAEIQYAKRQLTFMKKNKGIHWQAVF